jgi:branched-chain amino acid transport system permease protein
VAPSIRFGGVGWFGRLLVGLLVILLAGCSVVDPSSRDACLMVLPAIERPQARVIVLAVDALPQRADDVRIRYRVEGPGGRARVTETICAFGDDGVSGRRHALVGVRSERGDLGPARLYFLKRFWLGDPRAAGEAAARITFDERMVTKGVISLPPLLALILQWVIEAIAPCVVYAMFGLACALIWALVGRVGAGFADVAVLLGAAAMLAVVGLDGIGIGASGLLVASGVFAAVAVVALSGRLLGSRTIEAVGRAPRRPPLAVILALSIAVEGLLLLRGGADGGHAAPLFDGSMIVADGLFPVTVTPLRLIVAGVVVLVIGGVSLEWPRTRLGLAWRAVADDPEAARLLGVERGPVVLGSLAVAALLAVAGGIPATLAFGGASFAMGWLFGLGATAAAIAGGVGSLSGAVLGGFLLGVGGTVWSIAFGDAWRASAGLLVLVVFASARPNGLVDPSRVPDAEPPRR